jgi:nicotinate-nucleotide adenylyltransferase
MNARTVLFGGTFDPIHNAHLAVARAALETFQPRRILFVPAARPPHKGAGAHASYEDRAHMLDLACAGEPRFEVSRIEQPASSGDTPNYSILTIEKLLAAGKGPLGFLIGADAFAEITSWHRWQDVIRTVEFIVVTRPGATYEVPAGAIVHELGGLEFPESSSSIRALLAEGDYDVSVPPAVLSWIRERGIYRSRSPKLEIFLSAKGM